MAIVLYFVFALTIFTKNHLMKYICSILFVTAIALFSSCDKGTTNLFAVTPGDTTSKGSTIDISFNSKDLAVYDYSINGSPVITISSNIMQASSSAWNGQIVVTDYKQNQFALNLNCVNSTQEGTYTVLDNNSTFTDDSVGLHKVYSIGVGSTVTITQANYPIEGTMNLNLYYNHVMTPATGSFKIYH